MNKKREKRRRIIIACVTIVICLLCLQACQSGKTDSQDNLQQSAAIAETGEVSGGEEAIAENGKTNGAEETIAETGKTNGAEDAGEAESEEKEEAGEVSAETPDGATSLSEKPAAGEGKESAFVGLSPKMKELKEHIEEELSGKNGKWAMYLYRFDTGEEFGINEKDSMISASLIKLFIAGCYFDQIEKGVISDDYPNELYSMISDSDNYSTNTLIDVLGMDTINEFIRAHGFEATWLKRKMLEKNGLENYTSAEDCGHVLRQVYEGTYVNEEASARILDALKGQTERHKYKIPAGIPSGIVTANKTGELFTPDENGSNVTIQNDTAIVFAHNHNYILTVITAVPPTGEGEMYAQIAALSSEVYEAVSSGESDTDNTAAEAAEAEGEAEAEEQDDAGNDGRDGENSAVDEAEILEGEDTESVSEDPAVVLPEKSDGDK